MFLDCKYDSVNFKLFSTYLENIENRHNYTIKQAGTKQLKAYHKIPCVVVAMAVLQVIPGGLYKVGWIGHKEDISFRIEKIFSFVCQWFIFLVNVVKPPIWRGSVTYKAPHYEP